MSSFVKTLMTAAMIPALALSTSAALAAFSDSQQKEIQGVVDNYLKNNPQTIISALQGFQQKQMQEAEKTIKDTQKSAGQYVKALFHTANDPLGGNPNGTVTVVEFFDYQCAHCVTMAPVISDAMKGNTNVRFIFKEFPIRGPLSDFAARAALAANMQGKYMPFHDALLKASQPYTKESILAVAKSVGLNVEQLQKDMDSASVQDQIKANMKLAQDLKLLGTPAFFIGKTDATASSNISYIPGQMDINQLQ